MLRTSALSCNQETSEKEQFDTTPVNECDFFYPLLPSPTCFQLPSLLYLLND